MLYTLCVQPSWPSLTSRLRSASPFWRPPLRESAPKRSVTTPAGRDPNLVVGAAYSHADMLKFDILYVAARRTRHET